MNLNIKSGKIPSTITLPTSKSYANRALILAALKTDTIKIKNLPQALDVVFLLKALREIGLEIIEDGRDALFKNSFPQCEIASGKPYRVDVGEGGTTARFLACMLLKGSQPYTLILGSRLKDRPWAEFIQMARDLGAQCELKGNELFIQGPIKTKSELEIDCARTTQFATGMYLAFSNEMKITPINLETSQSYWEMTLEIIKHIQSQEEYSTPVDWSSASYSLAFAALNQKTFFPNLTKDRYQADSKFYDLLLKLGLLVQREDGVTIQPQEVKTDVAMDVSDCLDLVPTLVYFLSHVDGKHTLSAVENLVHKESDRLHESLRILDAFDKKYQVENNQLIIFGSSKKFESAVSLVMPDDHRMVMSAALFMRHNFGGDVSPKEAVNKSYPEFFDLFN